MATVKVSKKEEFERAVRNNEEKIIVTGDLADKIISAQKKKYVAKNIIDTVKKDYDISISTRFGTVEFTRR